MKTNYPANLFNEALRNENEGNFETAVIIYENALDRFKKSRLHSNLKNKTIKKLKVLYTITEYKSNLRFIR